MSARSRAFPWWGERKKPRWLFGRPIEYIDPSILDPASLSIYEWRDAIVFGRVRFVP